ncbi:MAG TPA: aminotransferase class I/II-fold pyridoxal phosphate-dependent enzyme [Bacteroidales bacterium]|nr:aminotransferase class I/II-fold pyridoxal phosphate-dependent enzyme [Bacteroidales bacterium]
MMDTKNLGFNSKLIHAGNIDDQFGSATVPIYQTSTFRFKDADHGAKCFSGESDGYIYTRINNPTIDALENLAATLENGYRGIATSSGMGAVNTIYMGLLTKGDHMISSAAVYGASRVIMEKQYSKYGIESTYVDTSKLDNIRKAIKPNTKVIFIETPANPTMDITDLAGVVEIAREHNLITVADNTFCSPYLQRPLEFGFDVVFHSVTKFLNGHADVVGGIIVTRDVALDNLLRPVMINLGCNMDPHQAYMVIRGIKTLSLRMERSQQNAMKIAQFLESHPKVSSVKYPGLESHPQYDLAKRQMSGPGAIISFELKGGLEAGKVLMNNVKLCMLAVSLGGVETLIQHPASMTHSKMNSQDKFRAGITDGLVRFSVGIEDARDIIADLEQALIKV